VVSGIAPVKSDLAINKRNQAMVGDGHAMGVATQVSQHVFGATEGTFQVDHPVLAVEWLQPGGESLRFCQKFQITLEVEVPRSTCFARTRTRSKPSKSFLRFYCFQQTGESAFRSKLTPRASI